MKKIKNLTPHEVNLINSDGGTISFPSEGVARVASEYTELPPVDGIRLVSQKLGKVTGLPEPEKGVLFIISRMVASAAPARIDVICPAELVRNDKGQVKGCGAFERCN